MAKSVTTALIIVSLFVAHRVNATQAASDGSAEIEEVENLLALSRASFVRMLQLWPPSLESPRQRRAYFRARRFFGKAVDELVTIATESTFHTVREQALQALAQELRNATWTTDEPQMIPSREAFDQAAETVAAGSLGVILRGLAEKANQLPREWLLDCLRLSGETAYDQQPNFHDQRMQAYAAIGMSFIATLEARWVIERTDELRSVNEQIFRNKDDALDFAVWGRIKAALLEPLDRAIDQYGSRSHYPPSEVRRMKPLMQAAGFIVRQVELNYPEDVDIVERMRRGLRQWESKTQQTALWTNGYRWVNAAELSSGRRRVGHWRRTN